MTKSSHSTPRRFVRGLQMLALLGAAFGAACSDGSSEMPCATYACVNVAQLSGYAALNDDSMAVDVQLCVDDECHTGTIARRAPNTLEKACLTWNVLSKVCLAASDTPGMVSIDVLAELAYDVTPHDLNVHLVLTIHDTGSTLLDETRVAKHEITREDNCHRCWLATATL